MSHPQFITPKNEIKALLMKCEHEDIKSVTISFDTNNPIHFEGGMKCRVFKIGNVSVPHDIIYQEFGTDVDYLDNIEPEIFKNTDDSLKENKSPTINEIKPTSIVFFLLKFFVLSINRIIFRRNRSPKTPLIILSLLLFLPAKSQQFYFNDLKINVDQFTGVVKNDILLAINFYSPTKKIIHVTISDNNNIQLVSETYSLKPDETLKCLKRLGMTCYNPYYITVTHRKYFFDYYFNLEQPKALEKDTIKYKLPGIPN